MTCYFSVFPHLVTSYSTYLYKMATMFCDKILPYEQGPILRAYIGSLPDVRGCLKQPVSLDFLYTGGSWLYVMAHCTGWKGTVSLIRSSSNSSCPTILNGKFSRVSMIQLVTRARRERSPLPGKDFSGQGWRKISLTMWSTVRGVLLEKHLNRGPVHPLKTSEHLHRLNWCASTLVDVLVVTDHFSKMAHAFPCRNQSAKQVAHRLWNDFLYLRLPQKNPFGPRCQLWKQAYKGSFKHGWSAQVTYHPVPSHGQWDHRTLQQSPWEHDKSVSPKGQVVSDAADVEIQL